MIHVGNATYSDKQAYSSSARNKKQNAQHKINEARAISHFVACILHALFGLNHRLPVHALPIKDQFANLRPLY